MHDDAQPGGDRELLPAADRRRAPAVLVLVEDRLARLGTAAAALRAGAAESPDLVRVVHGLQLLAEETTALAGWLRRSLVADLVRRGRTHDDAAAALGVSRQRVGRLLTGAGAGVPAEPPTRLPAAGGPAAEQDALAVPSLRLAEETLLHAAFDLTAHPVLLLDAAGRVVTANRAACEVLQQEGSGLVGRDYRAWTDEAHLGQVLVDHVRLLSGAASLRCSSAWVRRDGRPVPVLLTTHAVRGPRDRRLVGLVVHAMVLPASGDPSQQAMAATPGCAPEMAP